jgi:hypothetical protein
MDKAMSPYDEPFLWQDLTPLYAGEPIAVVRKEKVWFVKEPYTGGKGIIYEERVIPLQLYINQLLMLGKVTAC